MQYVELWYKRWGNWTKYNGNFTSSPISIALVGAGTYQFYSIAVDNLGNREDPPPTPDDSVKVLPAPLVPTLSQWGTIIMAVLFAGFLVWTLRKRLLVDAGKAK